MCYSFTQTCSPKRNCKRASFMVSLWHRVTSVSDIAKIFPCLLFFLDLCELGLAPVVGAREFQHVPPREHRRSRYAAALEEFWFCRPLDGFKTSCLSLSDQCLEFKSLKIFETTIWCPMVGSMHKIMFKRWMLGIQIYQNFWDNIDLMINGWFNAKSKYYSSERQMLSPEK